jgi:hypothetical protein
VKNRFQNLPFKFNLQLYIVEAIRLSNEANILAAEFDAGVRFKPTLVDTQQAMLRLRAPSRPSTSASASAATPGPSKAPKLPGTVGTPGTPTDAAATGEDEVGGAAPVESSC